MALESAHLIDVTPSFLVLTWINGRFCEGITERLDWFIIAKYLSTTVGQYRIWYLASGLSDHKLIILQLNFEDKTCFYPFKFNHTLLE